MPPILVHEDSVDTPDGVRVVYKTKALYIAGTVRVFRNGQLELGSKTGSGWTELGGKKIRFNTAPLTEDHITFQYRPLI